MISNDSRQNSSRRSERRSEERRLIDYAFGSPKWIDRIKEEYLLWPKQDRRTKNRRQSLRRIKNLGRSSKTANTNTMQMLLTEEEKQMLSKLCQSDDID